MASVTWFLGRELRIKVSGAKSAVDRPWNRKFPGCAFTSKSMRGVSHLAASVLPMIVG